MARWLGQGRFDHVDVVGRGVRPGVARARQDRQRFAGVLRAVYRCLVHAAVSKKPCASNQEGMERVA